MAHYTEKEPGRSDEFDVSAHLMSDIPDNFGAMFNAYACIRNGEEISSDLVLKSYGYFLQTDPNGIALRQAFDQVTADETKASIVHQAMFELSNGTEGLQLTDLQNEVRAILPPDFDETILVHPYMDDKKAA